MINRRLRALLLTVTMSLAVACVTTGCDALKKTDVKETETETQSETPTETESESETESETEVETEIGYTSQDNSIRITLPDSTWKVTQDADEMRVFSSGAAAMISIVHADDTSSMRNISVSESEDALRESLTRQYSEPNAFEIAEFEKLSTDTLNTYEYVVKYNGTGMWAYSITYGIIAKEEAYVITGTVTDDNKVLFDAVKKAVESFTVLGNSVFSTVPGDVVNKTGVQSESGVDGELKNLTDYGTSATLYANDTVNIRLQPSTESNDNIIGSLNKGDSVTVTGETPQWFKVNVNGHVGYISKAFLVNQPTSQTASQTDPENQNGSDTSVSSSTKVDAEINSYTDYGTSYTYYATTDVNLRAKPGTESDQVGSLPNGAAVNIIGETDNWYVADVGGVVCYVSKSYISPNAPSGGGDPSGGNGSGGGGGSTAPNTGTGTITGTVTGATMDTLTVQGDDGNVYTINYSDASLSTVDGIQEGLYISATVDYSNTLPNGSLYATAVSGN